mmetsp:Transcript_30806/g.53524  ORF Transcript_30806/g.53524 Transcript_30806/m.53524 type:complete len:260 (-) Transcript_30806:2293-3072(-)
MDMGTTEQKAKDKPSFAINEEPPIDRDCQKCLTYLTRALDRVGERPQSLLRALGVISHSDNNVNKLYEPTEDGRGVMITLKNNNKEVAAHELVSHGDGSQLQRREVMLGTEVSIDQGNRDKIPSPAPNDEQHSILVRRFTKAATLLADGIRHSAEDVMPSGGVLTTSPAAESTQSSQDQVQMPNKDVTIEISCQTCGSDTRAEAGARAFVRGPVPLSIVLCSNRLSSQREIDEVLVHELIHIYGKRSREISCSSWYFTD